MSQSLKTVEDLDLANELEHELLPILSGLIRARGFGHCMRLSDLDQNIMVLLCSRLRAEHPEAQVVILGDHNSSTPKLLTVSSTRLVELRNPLPDGSVRPPLLVFIPSGLRAAAEDSFGIATFEEISVGDVYKNLRARLISELPSAIRGPISEGLRRLEDESWPYADALSTARFLLTAKINGYDTEAVGAALFELALVPDFELFSQPVLTPVRMLKNLQKVRVVTWSTRSDRGRVFELGLKKGYFLSQLGEFFSDSGVEDPRDWTRRIALDRNYWKLAFHRWEFEEEASEQSQVYIGDVNVELPLVGHAPSDPKLQELQANEKLLIVGKGGPKKFSVGFRVSPQPSGVKQLAKFLAQVVSKDAGPVGLSRSKQTWSSNRNSGSIEFTNLQKVEWEEGWHYVRLLAQTEDGELIPLVDESGNPLPWAPQEDSQSLSRPNQSDLFYVLTDLDEPPAPPQRAVPRDASLEHARLRLQFAAILESRDPQLVTPLGVNWAERRLTAAVDLLDISFGKHGNIQVPVSRILRRLEQTILASPTGPLSWQLAISQGQVSNPTSRDVNWPDTKYCKDFLSTREAWFKAVQADCSDQITQAANLLSLEPLAISYAQTYSQLIAALLQEARDCSGEASRDALIQLWKILNLDTVTLTLTDYRGGRRTAALISPTHPLRVLWFVAWTKTGGNWLNSARQGEPDLIVATREALMRLKPSGFPPVLVSSGNLPNAGRLMTPVDNLSSHWSLYAPPSEEDPRGLVGEVCSALGMPEPQTGVTTIDGDALAAKVQRYLVQHPYVRILTINAFNPGRGGTIADMLLKLQQEPVFADICYDIRIFVSDAKAPGVGDSLGELLSSATNLTGQEADALAAPTGDHLRPKLAVAIRNTKEFRSNPEEFSAHLSFLFDIFPAEEVGVAESSLQDRGAPVHGLVQDYRNDYLEDDARVTWKRIPRHGDSTTPNDCSESNRLLSSLSLIISNATCTVATGQTTGSLLPVISLTLDPNERALLHQIHETTDWVFTIDRNMGIEFFDHGGRRSRPDYLIDYSPDASTSFGHKLTVTSRSVEELEAMLVPVLKGYGLACERRHAMVVLEQLRSLSGRLALKLISAQTQRAEALGLALSRLYLHSRGAFKSQIVVPLDAHIDLYRTRKETAKELGNEVSFKRTDLALFDLNSETRVITCRLVEVKCYTAVGDLSAYTSLKDRIAAQLAQSKQILSHHFDPSIHSTDRPDRLLKTLEFATLLEFYLERGLRYGILQDAAAEKGRLFLTSLESGYQLVFTSSALVFDFEKAGNDVELEHGIEFHRVGIDLIRELVDSSANSDLSRVDTAHSVLQIDSGLNAPSLDTAFLGSNQQPSMTPDNLTSRQNFDNGAINENAPDLVTLANKISGSVDFSAPAESQKSTSPAPGPELQAAYVHHALRPKPTVSDSSPNVSLASKESPLAPPYDVMIGTTGQSPQYGILGEVSGRTIAIDLNQTHTISLFGVQGGGKSYTLGTVAEMASLEIPGINLLPEPLATIIFHYSPTMDYAPEFTSMIDANTDKLQVASLRERYGAEPKALSDVLLLVPADKLEERRAEYPGIEVQPLLFAAAELQASHWRFLMGAVGNQANYIRQLNRIMKQLRDELTLDALRQGIEDSRMPDHIKELAYGRLELAEEFINDDSRLSEMIRPGRLVIVDLRDEFMEKDQALGLFVVLLQLFAEVTFQGRKFNKLVVFDEAHKYIESPDLVAGLVEVVREMRHKGTSIMVASQDPPSVPVQLIELSTQIILHKFNSPAWLKHIQKANAALGGLTPEKMAHLRPGEAFVWSSKATDETFSKGAIKLRCRPRVTQHGGGTKTAVKEP